MKEEVRRFGVLVPPANVAVEDEFREFVPRGVQFHTARLYRSTFETNYDTMKEMVESTDYAARCVAQVKPELIAWACTSGSFIDGTDHDEALGSRITEKTGIASITTSTAMATALRTVGARRVFLVTPYVKDLNDREVAFLESNGFAVTHTASFLHPHTLLIRATKSEEVVSLIKENLKQAGDFDTVFISCTQLHSMDKIAELEAMLKVPVVTSNQATLWLSLKRMGIDTSSIPAGRLFQTRERAAA